MKIYLIYLPEFLHIFITKTQKPSKDTSTGNWMNKLLYLIYSRAVRKDEETPYVPPPPIWKNIQDILSSEEHKYTL